MTDAEEEAIQKAVASGNQNAPIDPTFNSVFNWLSVFWYFFLVVLPTRPFKIRTVARGEETTGTTHSCFSKFIDVIADPVLGILVFYAYVTLFGMAGQIMRPITGLYENMFDFLPRDASIFIFPLFLFALRFKDFLRILGMHYLMPVSMYASVVAMTFALGFPATVLFIFTMLLCMHMAYARTESWERIFFAILVTVSCSNALHIAASYYYFGIVPPGVNYAVHFLVFTIFSRSIAWIDSQSKILIRDDERERFFQRGSVSRQLKYIKSQRGIFLIMTVITCMTTFGQLYSPKSYDEPETIATVFCKGGPTKELQCRVNVTYHHPTPANPEEYCSVDSEWDFCGSLPCSCQQNAFDGSQQSERHTHTRQGAGKAIPSKAHSIWATLFPQVTMQINCIMYLFICILIQSHILTEGCSCSLSGPCLSINQESLVSEASHYSQDVWLDDLQPNGIEATLKYYFYNLYDLLARVGGMFNFCLPRHHVLNVLDVQRKGFQVDFRIGNSLEPKITNWDSPLEQEEGKVYWKALESVVLPKKVEMKLTPKMMSVTGFTTFTLGDEARKEKGSSAGKSPDKQYYVGMSGGGWRALAGHMGVFRGLSNKNSLPMVKMFSSVSGGSWLLSKLSFDPDFSAKVLRSDTHITEVVLEYMERHYFPTVRDTMCLKKSQKLPKGGGVGSFLATAILQAPEPIKTMLGNIIIAAHSFNFSWQALVEEGVLGHDVADQPLDQIPLVPDARSRFGDATMAFNWNQLHRWGDQKNASCSKWYLKDNEGNHVQYPIYTSALYRQSDDDSIKVEINMKGERPESLYDACNSNSCQGPAEKSLAEMAETVLGLFGSSPKVEPTTSCDDFKFQSLTVGQVVSASSAAAGGAGVHEWVYGLIEMVRQQAKDALQGDVNIWYCSHYRMIIEAIVGSCNRQVVIDEFLTLLGCSTSEGVKEDAAVTSQRWTAFLEKLAVKMGLQETGHEGYMAIDAVR